MALCECHALPMVCSLSALQADCLAAASRAAERAETRIAALEAQVAALAGALRHTYSEDIRIAAELVRCVGPDDLPRKWSDLIDREPVVELALALRREADALSPHLTADTSHLAALDAARREVCAAAVAFRGEHGWRANGSGDRLRAALDALATLE